MAPLLSIVIPHYNHSRFLPMTLDSILRQTMRDFEVIVVDDCSEEHLKPNAVVEEYKEKGLPIRLIENKIRQYTLHSRLNGVRAATGELIYCMDSDDLLWGDAALERNVKILLNEGADILQFNILSSDVVKRKSFILATWAECERRVYLDKFVEKGSRALGIPEAPLTLSSLEGPEIFKKFVVSQEYRGVLWNKICRKQIWDEIIPLASKSRNIRRWEDYYLNALLLLKVKKFVGTSLIGYQHIYTEGSLTQEALSFAMWDIYHILQDVCPLLAGNVAADDLGKFSELLKSALLNTARWACKNMDIGPGGQTDDVVARIFGEGADASSVVKMLIYVFNLCSNQRQATNLATEKNTARHFEELFRIEQQRCQALKLSLSWRLTSPLRAIAKQFMGK